MATFAQALAARITKVEEAIARFYTLNPSEDLSYLWEQYLQLKAGSGGSGGGSASAADVAAGVDTSTNVANLLTALQATRDRLGDPGAGAGLTAGVNPALNQLSTDLSQILQQLQAERSVAPAIWTDDTGTYFYRLASPNEGTGQLDFSTITTTGVAYTPGANPRPFGGAADPDKDVQLQPAAYDDGATTGQSGFVQLLYDYSTPTPTVTQLGVLDSSFLPVATPTNIVERQTASDIATGIVETPYRYQVGAGPEAEGRLRVAYNAGLNPPAIISTEIIDLTGAVVAGATPLGLPGAQPSGLVNVAGTQINPATEDNQDTALLRLGDPGAGASLTAGINPALKQLSADIAAVVAQLREDRAIAPQLWTDDSGAFFDRVAAYNEGTNQYDFTFQAPLTGAAYTPGANPRPVAEEADKDVIFTPVLYDDGATLGLNGFQERVYDYATSPATVTTLGVLDTAYATVATATNVRERPSSTQSGGSKVAIATTAGTGYAVGDEILVVFDVAGAPIAARNLTQGTALATVPADSDLDFTASDRPRYWQYVEGETLTVSGDDAALTSLTLPTAFAADANENVQVILSANPNQDVLNASLGMTVAGLNQATALAIMSDTIRYGFGTQLGPIEGERLAPANGALTITGKDNIAAFQCLLTASAYPSTLNVKWARRSAA